jgi:hypothetical protein
MVTIKVSTRFILSEYRASGTSLNLLARKLLTAVSIL